MAECNWQPDPNGVQGGHRGEYDYICLTCRKTDWFPYYGLPDKDYRPIDCHQTNVWEQRR